MGAAGQNIRKLVKDGFVIKKPMKIHSRSRAREAQLAKSKGRHTGYGAQQLLVHLLLARGWPAVSETPPVRIVMCQSQGAPCCDTS